MDVKEAIQSLKYSTYSCIPFGSVIANKEAIETVLSELEKKDTEIIEAKEANRQLSLEIEKKDKVINEMSNFINLMSNELVAEIGDNNLEFCKMQKCIDNGELDCEECIKEYFTKKVEQN